jgi:hypothetical protein
LFVLLTGMIYEVNVKMVSDSIIYVPSFMNINSGIQVILRLLSCQFLGCSVGTNEERNFISTPLIWSQMS